MCIGGECAVVVSWVSTKAARKKVTGGGGARVGWKKETLWA